MVTIRTAIRTDADHWLRMRLALWPEGTTLEHGDEIARYFDRRIREPLEVLLAVDDRGDAVGFVELSIRSYAEDCETDRVAYLEGWYVVPEMRRRGVGAALVNAAERWGRAQGCTEFGSDTLIDNEPATRAHLALGFAETARLVCFRKSLVDVGKA